MAVWAKGMFRDYIKGKQGNIAISMAIMLPILLITIGVALDMSNMVKTQTRLQSLADVAVLAAAASEKQSQAELQTIAEDMVNANNFNGETLTTNLVILEDNTIKVNVNKLEDMLLLDIFNFEAANISVDAASPPKGSAPLNLALVLDSTQSMEGTKMTVLRTAANDLVDSLENDDDKVQISVIPFARYVRIPRSYDSEPWLEIAPTANACWMEHDPDNSVNCDPVTYDENENAVHICEINVEKEVCATIEYYGCVASRHRPDHLIADFSGRRIQGYTAGGSCNTELQPLTTNFTDVKNKINAMVAQDKTYMPSGLIWGWRSLTKNMPMTEANTSDFNERKSVMVLMSDGENTRSLADGPNGYGFNGLYHWDTDIDDANNVTSTLCTNIKNDNIDIYTVAFEVTDTTTLTILQNCATSPSQFYPADNAAQLSNAFETIGKKLAAVRLSQ